MEMPVLMAMSFEEFLAKWKLKAMKRRRNVTESLLGDWLRKRYEKLGYKVRLSVPRARTRACTH